MACDSLALSLIRCAGAKGMARRRCATRSERRPPGTPATASMIKSIEILSTLLDDLQGFRRRAMICLPAESVLQPFARQALIFSIDGLEHKAFQKRQVRLHCSSLTGENILE